MKKKILSILLVLSMLLGMAAILPIQIGASSVYEIRSASDYLTFTTMDKSGYDTFVLKADIDLTGKTVSQVSGFTGTFDGEGHTISGVKMETSGECGLFECSGGAKTIKNFVLENSKFKGKQWVGAICCDTNADTVIENVYVAGDVSVEATITSDGESYAGGFVGGMGGGAHDLTINNCVFAGTVKAEQKYSGGFVGSGNSNKEKNGTEKMHRIEINNCLMIGDVSTTQVDSPRTSGFVGYNYAYDKGNKSKNYDITDDSLYTIIRNSIDAGTGTNNYSRFADADNLTIENCYTTVGGKLWCDDYNGGDAKDSDTDKIAGKVTVIDSDDLMGLDAMDMTGFTKRDSDIMIPTGLVGIAPALYAAVYTVTWKNGDGTVIATEEYAQGSTPSYKGATPTMAADERFTYTYAGEWYPALTEVTKDATYTAKYDVALKSTLSDGYFDVWDGSADEEYYKWGHGTEEDPYIIGSAEQWANLAKAANKGIDDGLYFELAVNLDFNGVEGLEPIAKDGKKLLIYFDGKGHTIKGVNMSWTGDGTGLFGDIWGSANPADRAENTSVIKNLLITESTFDGEQYVGSLIGEVSGNVIVSNIYVDSSVIVRGSGTAADKECSVGGIIGGCYYGSSWKPDSKVIECTLEINDCVFAGKVFSSGTKNGGIVGNGNSKVETSKGAITQWELFHIVINNTLVTGYVQHDKDRSSGFVGHNDHTCKDADGNVYTYEDQTFTASVTLNGCIYAGGGEDVYFYNRPFFGIVTTPIVSNCYTTSTAKSGVYTNTKWTDENSGVTLIDNDDLLGLGATAPEGWVKRAGDIVIPEGVADFAPLTFTFKMIDGASVRFSKPSGLRFMATLGGAFLESFGENATFGIIIAPTDYIEINFETLVSDGTAGVDYVVIPATNILYGGADAGYYTFTGVLSNVLPENYERAFSAIAYVEVNGVYYLSNYSDKYQSRSISEVAQAAYNDTSLTQSEEYSYEIFAGAGVYSPYKSAHRDILPAFYGKTNATNVNMLSYNVLNVEGGDSVMNDPLTFEYDGRADLVIDYILSTDADVIGLQEVSIKKHAYNSNTLSWFTYLADLEAAGYTCYRGEDILADYGGNKEMYNPIYYKTSKYTCVDSGYQYLGDYTFAKGDGFETDYKGLTWVILKDNATGEQFVYVNVHMPRKGSTDDHEQDDAAADFMNYITDTFGDMSCPIFIGGDFNGSYSDYKKYCLDENEENPYWGSTAAIARDEATYKSAGCSTTNDEFTALGTSSGPIDLYYIVNEGNVDVYNYAVTDNKVDSVGKYPSDHLPVRLIVTLYGEAN